MDRIKASQITKAGWYWVWCPELFFEDGWQIVRVYLKSDGSFADAVMFSGDDIDKSLEDFGDADFIGPVTPPADPLEGG